MWHHLYTNTHTGSPVSVVYHPSCRVLSVLQDSYQLTSSILKVTGLVTTLLQISLSPLWQLRMFFFFSPVDDFAKFFILRHLLILSMSSLSFVHSYHLKVIEMNSTWYEKKKSQVEVMRPLHRWLSASNFLQGESLVQRIWSSAPKKKCLSCSESERT